MPLPFVNEVTITVTGTWPYADQTPATGTVVFQPVGRLVDAPGRQIIVGKAIVAQLVNGSISVNLPATDTLVLAPVNWTYLVTERLDQVPPYQYSIQLPRTAGPSVDLSQLAQVPNSPGTFIPASADSGYSRT